MASSSSGQLDGSRGPICVQSCYKSDDDYVAHGRRNALHTRIRTESAELTNSLGEEKEREELESRVLNILRHRANHPVIIVTREETLRFVNFYHKTFTRCKTRAFVSPRLENCFNFQKNTNSIYKRICPDITVLSESFKKSRYFIRAQFYHLPFATVISCVHSFINERGKQCVPRIIVSKVIFTPAKCVPPRNRGYKVSHNNCFFYEIYSEEELCSCDRGNEARCVVRFVSFFFFRQTFHK